MKRSEHRALHLLIGLTALAGLSGCSVHPDLLGWGGCGEIQSDYLAAFDVGASLAESMPTSSTSFPMAVVLSERAIDSAFQHLSSTDMPELTQIADVMDYDLAVVVQPTIPRLGIGGDERCPYCLSADLSFRVELTLAGYEFPPGTGELRVQTELGLLPDGDTSTALVGQFQTTGVVDFALNLGDDVADSIQLIAEPIILEVLAQWLGQRFGDARILTLGTWDVGQVDLRLEAHGPFVQAESSTVVIGLQTNLALPATATIEWPPGLPRGVDLAVVVHPDVLASMGQRMLYQDAIPQVYDTHGQPDEHGTIRFTLESVSADDSGALQATSTLWEARDDCRVADMAAAISVRADTDGVALSLEELSVASAGGDDDPPAQVGQMASGFWASLFDMFVITIRYQGVLAGESAAQTVARDFDVEVDSRSVSLFLDLTD